MKTKILILTLAALCCTSIASGKNCIEELYQTVSKFSNAEKVNLNGLALGLLKPFYAELKGFNGIQIVNAEDISRKEYNKVEKILTQCNSNDLETIISSNEENEKTRIWVRTEEEMICEIVIVALDVYEVSLVRIKGKIDPEQLNDIIDNN